MPHLAAVLLLTLAKYLGVTIIVFTRVASEDATRVHDERTGIDIDSIERVAIIVIIVRVVAFTPITGLGRVRVARAIPFPCTEWYLILAVADRH